VTSIGNEAFSGCSGIQHVYCYADQLPKTGIYVFALLDTANAILHVPASMLYKYQSISPWKDFGNIVALTDNDPNPTCIDALHGSWLKDNDYYDQNGRKLTGVPTKKGIYIHQRRKFMIK
jgi:hypothetical protein